MGNTGPPTPPPPPLRHPRETPSIKRHRGFPEQSHPQSAGLLRSPATGMVRVLNMITLLRGDTNIPFYKPVFSSFILFLLFLSLLPPRPPLTHEASASVYHPADPHPPARPHPHTPLNSASTSLLWGLARIRWERSRVRHSLGDCV